MSAQTGRTLHTRAELVRVGDEVCFANERFNFVVGEVSSLPDRAILRSDGGAASHIFGPRELLYVRRGRTS